MALKVWLPLNESLENKGVSDLFTFSYNNFIQQANGKIGKCYSGQGIYHLNEELIQNNWSLCAWVKSSTWSQYNDIILCKNTSTSDNCQFYFSIINGATLNLGVNAGSGSVSFNYAFATDTWYHVAATYDGSKYALYINGEQKKTGALSTTLKTGMNNLGINCRSTNAAGTGQAGDGGKWLNDIRVYDHALSAVEVKEISQGLILHYKLNDNTAESTINYIPSPYKSSYSAVSPGWDTSKHPNAVAVNGWSNGYNGGVSSPSTGYHAMWNIIDGIPTIVFQNHNSEIGIPNRWLGVSSSTINISIPAGTKYTISYEQRTLDTLGGYTTSGIYYKYSSSSSANFHDGYPKIGQNTILNEWQKFSHTFTRNSNVDGTGTNGTVYIYGYNGTESTIQVRNIQLEIKDHATGYTSSSRSISIIQDSSGYNHNGIINGNIQVVPNSNRYSNCAYIVSGNTDYIASPTLQLPGDAITMNFWFKSSNKSPGSNYHMPLEGTASSNQSYEMSIYSTGYLRGGLVIAGSRKVDNCTSTKLTDGNWHMCTMTYDGSIIKRYVDGVMEKSTSATGTLVTSTQFILGHYGSNTSYYSKEAYTSDVRIYVTALSSDDILTLYRTSARLDNSGNMHTFELNENKINLMWRPENARAAGKGLNSNDGLSAYTQTNCQVTCNANGYNIYRPANLTVANNNNTMYGGLRIRNSINSSAHIYDMNTDNIFNLQKNHTYAWIFTIEGNTTNAPSFVLTNNMGWGGGGLLPSPSNVKSKNISTNFNGKTEVFYKFTITDDVVKTCTTSYGSNPNIFTQGNQYLSYMDFGWYWGYDSTGTGTNIYVSNIRLYDITNIQQQLNKIGIANFTSFIEENYNNKILFDGEFYGQEFIEM